jgi:hypothetical protein
MSEKQDLGTVDLTVRTLNVLQNVNAPNISRIETKTIQNTADAVIIRAEVQAEIAVVTGLANVAQATATAAKFRVITALTDAAQYLNEIVWYQSQLYRCTTLSPVAWALESAIQPSSTGLVAAWPGEEVPEIPDGVAGTLYKSPPLWASGLDSWALAYDITGTLTISNGHLVWTPAAAEVEVRIYRSATDYTNKTFRVKIKYDPLITSIHYRNSTAYISMTLTRYGDYYLSEGLPASALSTTAYLRVSYSATPVSTSIAIMYIGDGSYATPSVDGSGNKNHGTVTGVTPCEGNHGKALIGDGINDIITFPAKAASARTFAAWVKFTATTADMRVMQVNNAADTVVVFALIVNAKKAKLRWSTAVPANATMEGVVDLNDDSWHLLAGTHDGTTAILYVDGIEVNRATSTLLNDAYSLGSIFSHRASAAKYAGAIGEVWNYSRALSAQELRGLALGLRPSLPYSLVDWRTDPANPANVVATTAPKNLGRYNGAHPASNNNGDSWTVYDTDDTPIERGVWYSNAGTPTRISPVVGETGYTTDATLLSKFMGAFLDVTWALANAFGTAADYGMTVYYEALGASTILAQFILAQDITATGTITGAKLRTSDGYAMMSDVADDEDGFKGITVSSEVIDEANPAEGRVAQLVNLYGFLGSRIPALSFQAIDAGHAFDLEAAVYHYMNAIYMDNIHTGVRLKIIDQAYLEATSGDAIFNADKFVGDIVGPEKEIGDKCVHGAYTEDAIFHALAPYIPNTDDTMGVRGGMGNSGGTVAYTVSHAKRASSTLIYLYVLSTGNNRHAILGMDDGVADGWYAAISW